MKRRSALIALGSLAFGSGAAVSSAGFQRTVEPSADLRAVVANDLEVKAGDAFDDEGNVVAEEPQAEKYVPFENNGSFFSNGGLADIEVADLPVATVNRRDENVNDEVVAQLAVDLSKEEYTFENVLQIENRGTGAHDVAIRYADGENDFYGDDVGDGDDEVSRQLVQRMFTFRAEIQDGTDKVQISPDASDADETPADDVTVAPGEKRNVDLKISFEDFTTFGTTIDPKEEIRNATDADENPFAGDLGTVQLLEKIMVGINDGEIE